MSNWKHVGVIKTNLKSNKIRDYIQVIKNTNIFTLSNVIQIIFELSQVKQTTRPLKNMKDNFAARLDAILVPQSNPTKNILL
jgi:hypothetical protein